MQSKIEDDLRKQKKECESLKIQKELAETALQKAHGITSTESLADWFEIKEVRISLFVAEKEIRKITQDRENLLESLDLAKGGFCFVFFVCFFFLPLGGGADQSNQSH